MLELPLEIILLLKTILIPNDCVLSAIFFYFTSFLNVFPLFCVLNLPKIQFVDVLGMIRLLPVHRYVKSLFGGYFWLALKRWPCIRGDLPWTALLECHSCSYLNFPRTNIKSVWRISFPINYRLAIPHVSAFSVNNLVFY